MLGSALHSAMVRPVLLKSRSTISPLSSLITSAVFIRVPVWVLRMLVCLLVLVFLFSMFCSFPWVLPSLRFSAVFVCWRVAEGCQTEVPPQKAPTSLWAVYRGNGIIQVSKDLRKIEQRTNPNSYPLSCVYFENFKD